MKVFARQEHSGHGVVIFLIQCRHAKRRRPRVLDQEARPHDQSQQKEADQTLFESPGRNVLPENGAGIIVGAVHRCIHLLAGWLLGNRPIQMPPPALTHCNGGKTGCAPLEISSRSWGRIFRTHGS